MALCRALIEKPDILLLDEPTNHLDAETVLWLEKQLREFEGTVIIATHDRYFLDNITKWILELDAGQGIPWEGNYSSWLAQKIELMEKPEKKASAQARLAEARTGVDSPHAARPAGGKPQARGRVREALEGSV